MQTNKGATPDEERNEQAPRNPVQAGREAIEAETLNEQAKPTGQGEQDDAKDADRWRNEG